MQLGSMIAMGRRSAGTSVVSQGLDVLRKYGANAHMWLPGIGTFNGSDLGNYLDSLGATLASADNPIGLVLDQLYGQGALGPELAPQSFLSWTVYNTPTSITANSISGDAMADGLYFDGLTVGATYRLEFAGTTDTTVTLQQYGGSAIYLTGFGATTFVAASTQFLLRFGAAGIYTVTKMSVKRVLGISASQATTANKPTLRRGITNQQLYSSVSSGIGNSTYIGGSTGTGITPTIAPNYGADPFGGNTACRVQLSLNGGTTTADRAYLSGSSAPLDLAPRTSATWVRTLSGTATLLTRYNGNTLYYTVDTNWQLIWVVGNSSSDPTHNVVEIRGGQSTPNSNTADLLVATHGVFLGIVTPAQILQCGGIPLTTTAAASSSAGNWLLSFTGGSQSLSFPQNLYSTADDHVVVQGATAGNASTTLPSFAVGVGQSRFPVLYVGAGGYLTASWRDDAGAGVNAISPSLVISGESYVVTARKVGTTGYIRKNGISTSVSITGLGTTTITSAFIGASPSASWVGSVYPTVVIKGTVSDADLLAIERMVGVLTGPTGVAF